MTDAREGPGISGARYTCHLSVVLIHFMLMYNTHTCVFPPGLGGGGESTISPTNMSMATQQYLRKHRLLGNAQPLPVAQTVGSNVLFCVEGLEIRVVYTPQIEDGKLPEMPKNHYTYRKWKGVRLCSSSAALETDY